VTVKRSLNLPHLGMQKPLATAGGEAQLAAAPDLKEHILIVDDEKRIVQIGREMLEHLGYRVTGHTSSMAALESVRLQPEIYDLVITDFTMPQMNGVELARELNRLSPGTPIILYTATSKAVSPEKARKVGIKDYLLKPVTAVELHQAIRRVLDAKLAEKRAASKQTPEK
jgi:two-component system cell cycle sensor histidine kinase/response regulator CckA